MTRHTARSSTRFVGQILLACVSLAAVSINAHAGGGPENVLLVVNQNSEASKTIANHYIVLRKIPPQNVLYLNWKNSLGTCSGKSFLDGIITPILNAVRERGLGLQIDYIVYSSDFPWRVDLRELFKDKEFPPQQKPVASLTGATYLWKYVAIKNAAFVSLVTNWYVPGARGQNTKRCQLLGNVSSHGFRSRYRWQPDGKPSIDDEMGQTYLLSTMLGVTRGRGNTVDEVLSYLRSAASADGTRPRGTVYYMQNKDIRSVTRHDCFNEVIAQLKQLGVAARIEQGTMPTGARDIIGLTTGASQFKMARLNDRILPGAICEHLTSMGGIMASTAGQTPLSEFLRYGAAGACGTVIEPYSIQAKFPLPTIHLHYARGCSLAEAFYQSVTGPYQLLIVGDALCQPWAVAPKVQVMGIKAGDRVGGTVSITPSATSGAGPDVALFEMFVDGRLVVRIPPGGSLALDTTELSDGFHELRVVGIVGNAIETQGRAVLPFEVKNGSVTMVLSVSPQGSLPSTATLNVSVRQDGATSIAIMQNSRVLARVEGGQGSVKISAGSLGEGPVKLHAVSEGPHATVSAPVELQVF